MVENFDDILPPIRSRDTAQDSDDTPKNWGGSSIQSVGINSAAREQRRARRAERRPFVPEGGSSPRSSGSLLYWAIGLVVLALGLVVAGFLFFVNTTVVVTPYHEALTLANSTTISAYANPEAEELGFTTYTDTAEKSTSLTATSTTYVERYASGVITVYNNYDASPQRLIKNTRFENKDGKIYRVRNSIIVPGKTSTGPGSIDVTIYADVAGEASNMQDGTFTIPGLKDDPRFDAFSATVKTPITGGFSGNEPAVDQAQLEQTRNSLRTEIQQELLAKAHAALSADVTLFDSLATITFESTQSVNTDGSLSVIERGNIQMPVFNATQLSRVLLNNAMASAREGAVLVDSYDTVTVTPVSTETSFSDAGVVQFTVSGTAQVTWQVDTAAFARDLAGKHQSILNNVAAGYPGIQKASATIRPFWKTSFPSDSADIQVLVQ